jgi:hypothetical protein
MDVLSRLKFLNALMALTPPALFPCYVIYSQRNLSSWARLGFEPEGRSISGLEPNMLVTEVVNHIMKHTQWFTVSCIPPSRKNQGTDETKISWIEQMMHVVMAAAIVCSWLYVLKCKTRNISLFIRWWVDLSPSTLLQKSYISAWNSIMNAYKFRSFKTTYSECVCSLCYIIPSSSKIVQFALDINWDVLTEHKMKWAGHQPSCWNCHDTVNCWAVATDYK